MKLQGAVLWSQDDREEPQVNPTHPASRPPLPISSPEVLSSSLPGPRQCKEAGGGGWLGGAFSALLIVQVQKRGHCKLFLPSQIPSKSSKGRNRTSFKPTSKDKSLGRRAAQAGLRPRLSPGRGQALSHLTFLVRGVQGPPSARMVASGFPKARARVAGLGPKSAAGVRPASDLGEIFLGLFVHFHDGPQPCVCPGGSVGPFPCRGPSFPCRGPCPFALPRFSPFVGPQLCPTVARGGDLGPGEGAGLDPALSAESGALESPTCVPWPSSASPPQSDPRATIHKFPRQVAKPGGGARWGGPLTCAHAP